MGTEPKDQATVCTKEAELGEGRLNWRIIRKGGCGRDGDDDDDDDNILSAVCDGLDPYNSPLFI
jgi:hypothetical protein